MTEDGVRPGDAALAGEGQVETASHAISVDGGNRRRWKAGNSVHERLSHLRETKGFGAGEGGDLVQVGSGGKEVRVAGEDEFCGTLVGEFAHRGGQCVHSCDGQAVGTVVGDEAEDRDARVAFDGA